MKPPKNIVFAQLLISLQMAFLMTGIFAALANGVSFDLIPIWFKHFITAWPVAFVLSMITSRIAFSIIAKVEKKKTLGETEPDLDLDPA
ncbi:MAG: DUF2798 domain-containing protein [Bdellovibrionota bacterium]|nr:DUF2798 domain-containing protein [Bdellovibrionota bacterium]